jgi:hypothetical protein
MGRQRGYGLSWRIWGQLPPAGLPRGGLPGRLEPGILGQGRDALDRLHAVPREATAERPMQAQATGLRAAAPDGLRRRLPAARGACAQAVRTLRDNVCHLGRGFLAWRGRGRCSLAWSWERTMPWRVLSGPSRRSASRRYGCPARELAKPVGVARRGWRGSNPAGGRGFCPPGASAFLSGHQAARPPSRERRSQAATVCRGRARGVAAWPREVTCPDWSKPSRGKRDVRWGSRSRRSRAARISRSSVRGGHGGYIGYLT